jgi:short subunit dehydrogenase-like uncharacterized protein
MTEKSIDICVFGATGFTGQLVAFYLANRSKESGFRLGLAGRDPIRLEQLKKDLESSKLLSSNITFHKVDAFHEDQILALAKKSKIMITTVGPYLQYGEPVVKACVQGLCHYLDLTGEGKFVEDIFNKYNDQATKNKLKIITCAGFDSIPADIGTLYTVSKLPADEPKIVRTYLSTHSKKWSDSFSGGTWHSALGFLNPQELIRIQNSYQSIQKLSPNRTISHTGWMIHYRKDLKSFGIPLPFVDVEMVLKSAVNNPIYGPKFEFGHYAQIDGIPSMAITLLGAGVLFSAAQIPFLKEKLLKLKMPGEGPNSSTRETNSFELKFMAESPTATIFTSVSGGDPGYGETSKMISEAAILLFENDKSLPNHYGVITPAMGLGMNIIPKLKRAGLKFETLEVIANS